MKQTTYEEFVDLSRRGTFVPVVKEIIADLLTPVSAFLKIAEHSDYAFLFESVEGGERVARYSFLGKDPFLVLKARGSRTTIDRAGVRSRNRRAVHCGGAPHHGGVPGALRARAAALHRRRGGVHRLRRRAAVRAGALAGVARRLVVIRTGGRRCGVHAVRHGAGIRSREAPHPIVANARITADEDLQALYQFACAKIQFLERELERSLSQRTARRMRRRRMRSNQTREQFEGGVRTDQGAHRRRRHLPGGPVAALRGRHQGRSVHRLPRAAPREPVAVHVFHPPGRPGDRRLVARDAGAGGRAGARRRIRSPARGRAAATRKKTCGSAKS